jgi:hypothetical protein
LDDTEFFATLSFKGERFNGTIIPVDALPAIAAYQETLIEMAKAIWYEENPERSRLPKGFVKAFDLGLKGIGEGSKIAQLPRIFNTQDELFQDFLDDVFVEAQERIADAVLAANDNKPFRSLPENVISPFEKMSKSIESSEYIDVDPLANGKKRCGIFRLSERSVSRIVDESRAREVKKIDDIGFVIGLSESPSSIKISSARGSFVYPISWSDLRSNEKLKIGAVLSYSIMAEVDRLQEIKTFQRPIAISPVIDNATGERLRRRITAIAELNNGWLNGKGQKAVLTSLLRSEEMVSYLSRKFEELVVFPDEEGGIQFEWTVNQIAASLLVQADSFLLGASDLNSDKFREKSFNGVSGGLLRQLANLEQFVGRLV